MDFVYRFPVVKGIQAQKEYYIAMVPLKMISHLFPQDEDYLPPEYRAQRRLNTTRIPVIAKYILDNRDSYVFSALAASIDGCFSFTPCADNSSVGILEVPMDATFLINDGQHRKAAILEAIKEDSSLLDETIPVVFFKDSGLSRSQQMFTDLNKHAVRTSNSIAELYDSRDELAVVTRKVITKVPFLNEYTDKEKDILGKYSYKLFTLNTFYTANKRIIHGTKVSQSDASFLQRFWSLVSKNTIPWTELASKEIKKIDLREDYIVTQAVTIQALGRVGSHFYSDRTLSMEKVLKRLQQINWRRDNQIWRGRTIRANGRILTSETATMLTSNAIISVLGIPFTSEEKRREDLFLSENGFYSGEQS